MRKQMLLLVGLLTAGLSVQPVSSNNPEAAQPLVPWLTFQMKNLGAIVVELFPEVAPLNVRNVETLAAKGFYDGLTFHRVVPGFVIQGGDPTGTGAGGPDYTVPAEIKLNHVRGGFAMARTNNPAKASSSCQFYINLADLPMLDGNYTVIGEVREGMDVVDAIAAVTRDENDRPIKPVVIEKVKVEYKPMSGIARPFPGPLYMNIDFKDYGSVKVELFPDDAPNNVASIRRFAETGFYDGVNLRAVIPGLAIQGADKESQRGGCMSVAPEFKRKNVRGALVVGNVSENAVPATACEFFILLADQPKLDKIGYTVIGQVISGMEIVDKIAKVKRNKKNEPLKPVVMDRVWIEQGARR